MAISDKLLDVAQRVADQYYQDFMPADAFFKLDDFAYWIGKSYEKNADETAQLLYKSSLAETGQGYITFPQDWWQSKEFDIIKKDGRSIIELDIQFLGFPYDTQNSGIQLLMPAGNKGKCGNFIRTTLTELWQLNHVTASSNIWWYVEDNIVVLNYSGNANPKRVKIFYIPTIEDANFNLPKNEFDIAVMAWNFLMQAKAGTPIIDQTNDLNRNKTIQTEVNQKQLQPL